MQAILAQGRREGIDKDRPDVAPFVPAVRPLVWDELARRLPDGEALIAKLVEEVRRAVP